MDIINCVDDLKQILEAQSPNSRLCFKDYLDKNSNIIYGIDEIKVDNDKTTIQFIVKDANVIQNPYSVQDVEEIICEGDTSYYIQVVKSGKEHEDIFEVGMSIFNKGFTCSVKSEKRWVMYCV